MDNSMHSTAKQPLGHQVPPGNQKTDLAAQNMEQLLLLKKLLGIEIEMFDRKLNRICAEYRSLDQFLGNPETLGRLTQDLYVCDSSKTQWFMLSIRKGKLKSIRSVLSFHVNWINVINKPLGDPDDLIVGYSPGAGCGNTVTVVPLRDFCPERITKHFPFLIGQNANDTKEIGKLLCYVLRHYVDPGGQKQTYIGKIQGFTKTPTGKIKFSPPLILHSEYQAHIPPALQIRQYPNVGGPSNEDISPVLLPLFKQKKRFPSWASIPDCKLDAIPVYNVRCLRGHRTSREVHRADFRSFIGRDIQKHRLRCSRCPGNRAEYQALEIRAREHQ